MRVPICTTVHTATSARAGVAIATSGWLAVRAVVAVTGVVFEEGGARVALVEGGGAESAGGWG